MAGLLNNSKLLHGDLKMDSILQLVTKTMIWLLLPGKRR